MTYTMKLINMTDFVLSMVDNKTALEIANISVKYAKFLKQPLEFVMFFAHDTNGQIIFEFNYDKESLFERMQLDKVLFNYPSGLKGVTDNTLDILKIKSNSCETLFYYNEDLGYFQLTPYWQDKTIEDLIGLDIELTPSAIKQFM